MVSEKILLFERRQYERMAEITSHELRPDQLARHKEERRQRLAKRPVSLYHVDRDRYPELPMIERHVGYLYLVLFD